MFNIVTKEMMWGGRKLTLQTGKIARQADGSVLATYGETVVLATIVFAKKVKEGQSFFPLTVHYVEKAFAAGKIPGGFFKREGRPSEKEVLTSRLIDRPLRPLFPENFFNETQIICTVLSHDLANDPDIVALVASAAAVAISGVPHHGTLAGARVGYINGHYSLNPILSEMVESSLDLIVAGTNDSVFMVESEAKELSEEVMLGALKFGQEKYREVIALIDEFADAAKKEQFAFDESDHDADLKAKVKAMAANQFVEAYNIMAKSERSKKLDVIRSSIEAAMVAEGHEPMKINSIVKYIEKDIVRGNILNNNLRIDGRDTKTVRQINVEVGLLPKTHGSALFTRGETQALAVATLGTSQDEQILDRLEGEAKEYFMLHYNFPPYSVGESTPLRAPGRREIGHGKLAWRALHPLIPAKTDFPYTLRVVSEITESNGSSSMATVCATTLALMDAGVPLARPVAGIAMGLIKEGDKFAVLSDILGDEDHLGDMDFKVAGTKDGVTALQMDIKIKGITYEIMEVAVHQAQEGRMHILDKMNEVLPESRSGLSKNAPTITTIKINKDKIREVIGSGGKVIREICEVSKAKIDIEDDGTVKIAAVDAASSDIALKMIRDIVAEPEVGKVYEGKVVRIADFGAFVNFMGATDGLVHVSEMADQRVNKVTDVVNEGDIVKVKLLGFEKGGKVRLSMKAVDQATGEPKEGYVNNSEGGDAGGERRSSGGRRDSRSSGSRDSKGPRDRAPRESKEGGEASPAASTETRETREPREQREPREPREPRVEKRKYFS